MCASLAAPPASHRHHVTVQQLSACAAWCMYASTACCGCLPEGVSMSVRQQRPLSRAKTCLALSTLHQIYGCKTLCFVTPAVLQPKSQRSSPQQCKLHCKQYAARQAHPRLKQRDRCRAHYPVSHVIQDLYGFLPAAHLSIHINQRVVRHHIWLTSLFLQQQHPDCCAFHKLSSQCHKQHCRSHISDAVCNLDANNIF